jgi:hypothetical protein
VKLQVSPEAARDEALAEGLGRDELTDPRLRLIRDACMSGGLHGVGVSRDHMGGSDLVAIAFHQPAQRGHARFEREGRVLLLEVPSRSRQGLRRAWRSIGRVRPVQHTFSNLT